MRHQKLLAKLDFVQSKLLAGLIYLILCLLIGEQHPFSLVPMYNSFPNWAYSFYLTDSLHQLMTNQDIKSFSGADLTHKYFSICEHEKIKTGYEMETEKELSKIGQVMTSEVKDVSRQNLPKGKLLLWRKCYVFNHDSIEEHNLLMYETDVE